MSNGTPATSLTHTTGSMNGKIFISSFVALLYLASGQSECEPGFYSNGNRCRQCPRGQFQALAGQTSCEPCPEGTVASYTASTECVDCPELSRANRRRTRCNCQRGRALRNGKCELCKPGTFWQTNYGSPPSCELCRAGTFQTESGKVDCEDCPKGTSSGKGATECITCGEDEYVNNNGKCATCPPGRYFEEYENKCRKCEMNRFKSGKGLGPCLPCPLGQFALEGASKCFECPDGSVLLRGGRCLKCPAGSRLNERQMTCDLCPINTYMPYESVETRCFRCSGPMFAMEGATECTRCPRNTVLMQDGSCAACPDGSLYNDELFKCEECGVNQFTRGDMDYCESCPSLSYSRPGASTCFACPVGQAFISSRDKCGTCGRGKEYDSYRGRCRKCYEGSYKADVGIQACDYCDSGESNAARTACLD